MSFLNRNGASSTNTGSNSSYAYRELETPRSATMFKRDWRTALHTPPTYRIGNRTVRFNFHFALLVVGVCSLFVLFFYIRTDSRSSSDIAWLNSLNSVSSARSVIKDSIEYNNTYPLTQAKVVKGNVIVYRIGMVADLDKKSKFTRPDGSTAWRSYLKRGYLSYAHRKRTVSIEWDDDEPIQLESDYSQNGRGMELSELVTFNGKLLSFDDRTGLVYEIVNSATVLPWIILTDGDGHQMRGFKSEWATIKGETMIVGSIGKEWTSSSGEFEHNNPMFIKIVSPQGSVRAVNWTEKYKTLRLESRGIHWPGYMIHESGLWSEIHQKWFFLPRRCSKERYNETLDELISCNVLISANDHFTEIKTIDLKDPNTKPTHGFSSFKFIPGSSDRVIVAIKTEELNEKTSTFISVFDVDGNFLSPEEKIDTNLKYEGFEFI